MIESTKSSESSTPPTRPDDAAASREEVIPAPPTRVAEVQPAQPGEATLPLALTLSEIGAIAASLQTAVHAGWVREPQQLNVVNSVLRKFHDAKEQLVAKEQEQ